MESRVPSEDLARSGVLVRIPSALLSFTGGQDEILLDAADLASVLARLDEAFPGIGDRIVDEAGQLRQFVNVFVNAELIRAPPGRVALAPGDEVHILPSVAGGSLG
ncbi:MAG TPA: MoaD/ThiS family protein [Thermoplasmata archaeon]|nr:MoaD/ThiS family protein [Thermoplasmata archaeon]